jgi:replicative DNA helicase
MEEVLFCNQDAEKAVLGAFLIDPNLYYECDLTPEHFALGKHQVIFRAIERLVKADVNPDLVTLREEIERMGSGEVVTYADLLELINATPTTLHFDHHVGVVKRHHQRRILLSVLQDAVGRLSLDDDPDAVKKQIVDGVSIASEGRGAVGLLEHLDAVYDEIYSRFRGGRRLPGLPTGFSDLDDAIGGVDIENGMLIYIAGEPGAGKTAFALQLAVNLADERYGNTPGAIYSLEMSAKQLIYRMASMVGEHSISKLVIGDIGGWEDELVKTFDRLSGLPVYLCEDASLTTASLRADLARLRQKGVRWFILDYLHLLNGYNQLDDVQRTERLSRDLVEICRTFRMAGIVLGSVTKDVMDGSAPTKRSLRGSGQIIHDADVVMFIAEAQKGLVVGNNGSLARTVMIEKNRNGKSKVAFDVILNPDRGMKFLPVLKTEIRF